MKLYENVSTEAISLLFKTGAKWKKELVFNFLLKPFDKYSFEDITDISTQDVLKGTIPDFTIYLKNNEKLRFEVKTDNTRLSDSEQQKNKRDAFLVKSDYAYWNDIPLDVKYILTWDDLFYLIDEKEASDDFEIFDLIRHSLFGNISNKDFEFLSHFLYSEEIIKNELKDTFRKFVDIVKKDDSINIKEEPIDFHIRVVLQKGRSTVSLEYEFGDQYHIGKFIFDSKTLTVEKDIGFMKPFDRILYLCEQIYSLKNECDKIKIFFVDETELRNRFLCHIKELSTEYSKKIYENILEENLIPLLDDFAKSKDLQFNYNLTGSCYSGFSFERNHWKSKYGIGFEFQKENYDDLIYGIYLDDGNKTSASKAERIALNKLYPESKKSELWPCWFGFNEYRNWTVEVFMNINNKPEEMASLIINRVLEILEKIDYMKI